MFTQPHLMYIRLIFTAMLIAPLSVAPLLAQPAPGAESTAHPEAYGRLNTPLSVNLDRADFPEAINDRRLEREPSAGSSRHHPSSLKGKKVLLYTKNGEGFVHDNIPASIQGIQKLADENGFEVVASEDPGMFTAEKLKPFDVLIFSNTNNNIFDTKEQEEAFQNYIQSGGRFVAIHSASGSERDWPWFWRNLGGKFFRHAQRQDFDVKVIDKANPSTEFLPDTWSIKEDECYYLDHLNPDIHVLVVSDLTTVEDEKRAEYPGDTFGNTFPTTWCHTTDGGRQWYTSLGHRPEQYFDPMFMRHILGGIQWVLEE